MRTPPFLLGAVLLFWGWQTHFLAAGAIMAVVLEGSRILRVRWDFSEEDFSRIWMVCAVLFLAGFAYAFTTSEGVIGLRALFENPGAVAQRTVTTVSARTAATFIGWLPMVFFLFMVAQAFHAGNEAPLAAISLYLRRRRKLARAAGRPVPPSRGVNVTYPYLMICLMAASVHGGAEQPWFFWGLCLLVAWALWPQRSRWYGSWTWAGTLTLVILLSFGGQIGINQFQRWLAGYNPKWLTEMGRQEFDPLQSRTGIGQIGRKSGSGRIIIRLEPKNGSRPPTYLRSASYRIFRSPNWSVGGQRDNFEPVIADKTSLNWLLVPGKTNIATNTIACYLPGWRDSFRSGLLPLPTGCGRLENLPAYTMQKNGVGAVLAQGPGLVVFDACSGPGPTLDTPPGSNDVESVPEAEIPALRQVVKELQLSGLDTREVLHRVGVFFQDKFSYGTWEELDESFGGEQTSLSQFLTQTRRGHCEYFAAATVLLLRQAGIPARYAVGYAVHEAARRGYVVRERDAHAWCLVWQDGIWQDFDTTPASWSAEEAKRASPWQALSDGWARLKFEFSKFRWGHAQLQQYMFLAAVPILCFLLYQIIFRRNWRSQRKKDVREAVVIWPGLDSEFYALQRKLEERGLPRQPNEPLSTWLERALRHAALGDLGDAVRSLLRLHYRHRFDPQGLAAADREELRRGVRGCLESLAALQPALRRP